MIAAKLRPRGPLLPEPRRVLRVVRETHDTVSLTIAGPAPGGPLLPGQFSMLYAFGVGEVPISASGEPGRAGELVHTIKAVGAVTASLCALRRGDMLGLRGPYGRPWPVDEVAGRDLLLLAGGVGLAPLRPVVHHVLRNRRRYGRVSLLVGARTPSDLLFRRQLERWQARGDLQLLSCVDRAPAGWGGRVGVVPALLDQLELRPARTVAFLCGPEVMMRVSARRLRALGLGDEQMYLSLERNMKCATGLCGHCQLGPTFVCKDGPVYRLDHVEPLLLIREL